MGILDLMLGRTDTGEQGVEGKSYTLPKESHEFVSPVAVRRAELEAFEALLEADADTPALEGDTEELQEALDTVFDGQEIDASEITEQHRKPRLEAAAIVEAWREHVDDELGVVYARSGTHSRLVSFVARCKRRADDADDPFELPDSFGEVAALLTRLEDATGDQYRAVVHADLVPPEEQS